MKKLLELCLKWRLLVFAFVVIVAAVGVRSAQQLPIDAVPDITNVQVQVLTNVPALGPVDVERTITFPVESSMSGLPGVEEIRSVSRFGLSAVTVVFEEGTDLLRARQLISSVSFRRVSVFPLVLRRSLAPSARASERSSSSRCVPTTCARWSARHGAVLHADGAALRARLVRSLRAALSARCRRGQLLRRRAEDLRG
jgi:hypothetical protein